MKTIFAQQPLTPQVDAILSAELGNNRDEFGALMLYTYTKHKIRLVGANFTNKTEISFTTARVDDLARKSGDCDDLKKSKSFSVAVLIHSDNVCDFEIELDDLDPGEKYYFVCVKEYFITTPGKSHHARWTHQGMDSWKSLGVKPSVSDERTYLLPLAVQVVVLVVLLCLSGLFSGLNLGLMALDQTELKIIEKCGSSKEKKYAKVIGPLRKRGNFLLCTLLLGNVLVNNTLTILLDNLSNGVIAVVCSTTAIVIFGEIVPQAICSRHGLAVGARTIWLTRFFMIITFPVSFPISMLLDKILGEEIGQVYNKEKLQELIRMTADINIIQNEEANIITGALELSNKACVDIMTNIEDVYMLDINTNLDFETMSEIMEHGYTRIPVYDGDKSRIVNLLNIKDLALLDPDDNTPLMTVCKFYDHRPLFVDDDAKLDFMLQEFLHGNSHMAIVQRLCNDGDCDPYYDILGVITLEDVIEEIIQTEIVDETDVLTDNRKKKPRKRLKQDYSVFNPDEESGANISPQLALAALQFLSTAVEPFSEEYISRSVLKRLIRQNIVVSLQPTDTPNDKNYIYKDGVEADYFVLILQGSAEVLVGKEKMLFVGGPFSYFGVNVLKNITESALSPLCHGANDTVYMKLEPYKPDFTLQATTFVQFLRIRRVHYIVARRTTVMVHKQEEREDGKLEEHFQKEWCRATSIVVGNAGTGVVDGPSDRQQHKTDGDQTASHSDFFIAQNRENTASKTDSLDDRTKDANSHCASTGVKKDVKLHCASVDDTMMQDITSHSASADDRTNDVTKHSAGNDPVRKVCGVDGAQIEVVVPDVIVVSPNHSEGENADEQTPLVHGDGNEALVTDKPVS
ncbi:metal transporter CNNM4-like [Gigantopelta aegis]|uniref:metal transporter CNNM4-like n=1 Tax=Gigantopelta aegis TaxID=1735272 RepID=UPI001B88D4AC|nr:metal transporter CNNM4-like [Gigantopelta aegis]